MHAGVSRDLRADYRIIFCWCQGVIVVVCCLSRPQRAGGGSALKLKKKDKDVDMFVDKLVQEGERVTSVSAPRQSSMTAKAAISTPHARWTLLPLPYISLPSLFSFLLYIVSMCDLL
jgi:hypothetical protein